MEEFATPYRKLNNKRKKSRCSFWCFSKHYDKVEKNNPEYVIKQIEDATDKIMMKIRNLRFQADELERKAKSIGKMNPLLYEELRRQWAKIKQTEKVFVKFYGRLFDVHHQIHTAATIKGVAVEMGVANDTLDTMLEELNLGDIDGMMADLQANAEKSRNVGEALTFPGDDSINEELIEWDEQEAANLDLPAVPLNKIPIKENKKINKTT